ncbi:MAG: chpA [Ignavibacteria bacterium]|nr:chpA [Ignavibacteria bacterium]
MKQKDIYFADLNPIKGSEQRRIRPVVIISGNAMNDNLEICMACPLSTSLKYYSGSVFIFKDRINNLERDSEVITFQIRSISKERLIQKIGEISNNQLLEIKMKLNEVLSY